MDVATSVFCTACVTCQTAQEIKERGVRTPTSPAIIVEKEAIRGPNAAPLAVVLIISREKGKDRGKLRALNPWTTYLGKMVKPSKWRRWRMKVVTGRTSTTSTTKTTTSMPRMTTTTTGGKRLAGRRAAGPSHQRHQQWGNNNLA